LDRIAVFTVTSCARVFYVTSAIGGLFESQFAWRITGLDAADVPQADVVEGRKQALALLATASSSIFAHFTRHTRVGELAGTRAAHSVNCVWGANFACLEPTPVTKSATRTLVLALARFSVFQ
jgi:hypothetical protein